MSSLEINSPFATAGRDACLGTTSARGSRFRTLVRVCLCKTLLTNPRSLFDCLVTHSVELSECCLVYLHRNAQSRMSLRRRFLLMTQTVSNTGLSQQPLCMCLRRRPHRRHRQMPPMVGTAAELLQRNKYMRKTHFLARGEAVTQTSTNASTNDSDKTSR